MTASNMFWESLEAGPSVPIPIARPAAFEASERAYTGAEDHVGNRVVGDTDAVRGKHVDVLLGDPDDVGPPASGMSEDGGHGYRSPPPA